MRDSGSSSNSVNSNMDRIMGNKQEDQRDVRRSTDMEEGGRSLDHQEVHHRDVEITEMSIRGGQDWTTRQMSCK
jgi:hypothetical protein